jgi:hypothetical protein
MFIIVLSLPVSAKSTGKYVKPLQSTFPYFTTTNTSLTALRTNNVPRFLFRAWNSLSGDGYPAMINSTTEIVPHGFMHCGQGHTSYDMSEHDIYHMAEMHFHMHHEPI